MFIRIGAFNFVNVIPLSSVNRNKKVKKRTETYFLVQLLSPSRCKPTLYPKDISLLLGSIVIAEQV